MKLHRLEIEGFGPYRERQSVDFDAFSTDGIFLIAGRTGAGKSSILDGVCFALYGTVPRYDGSEKRLRSDHCGPDDRTEVVLEFTVAGARWRATRAPEYERPKRRGGGMTVEGARAQLDECVDGVWLGRAAGPRDVASALDEIVGLTHQQFLQVILLAQNRFQRFLLARNDERQALLRTLFGTRTYEHYEKALDERRKRAEAAAASGAERIAVQLADAHDLIAEHDLGGDDAPGVGHDDAIARAARAAQRAAYRAETAAAQRDTAHEAQRAAAASLARTQRLHQRRVERERSRGALAALQAADQQIASERVVLERAIRAEALRAPIEGAQSAAAARGAAHEVEAAALSAWLDAGEKAADTPALTTLAEHLSDDLALARAALDREGELDRAESAAASAASRLAGLEAALVEQDAQRDAIPALREHIERDLAAAVAGAAGLDGARDRCGRLAQQAAAARAAAKLAAAVAAAEAAHVQRSRDLERAVGAVTALLQRRLAGHAGELAAGLIDGEPCAVCGAVAHPRPAPSIEDPVTDDMIAAAESARDAASGAERHASDAARAARTAHADVAAHAGGATADEVEERHTAALAEVTAAEQSALRRDRLHEQRNEIAALQVQADDERAALANEITHAREAATAARTTVEALRAVVAAARGPFESVTARVRAIEGRRDLARALLAARAELDVRIAAARTAEDDCDARVAASDFDDASAATAALCDATSRARLDAHVRAHENALHAERDRLRDLELELAGIADEDIDVDAAARASEETRARWDVAVTAAESTAQAASRLGRIVARAIDARAAIADLADECAAITRLADTVSGRAPNTHRMTLETFVLAAELEEIVDAANRRLHEMSSGRYRLQHTDARAARNASSGLGIEVLDAFTGQARPTQSLSGGETFLASLALALGLAEVVTNRAGGLRLDTLFIDEGFGSLDADTLDLAMATLDQLRQGGRTVGVISHVEAMKEQLPAQLVVAATSAGSSVIRQGVGALV